MEVLQVERRVEVEALAPRCPPQRHLVALADPAMRGAGLVLRVHGIGEVDDLVGGQPVEQLVVSRDEDGLPGLIRAGRQAFRALVFEAQAMQQRQATRMAVSHAPSRRDIGRHLAAVAHQPFARPRRKLRHPFAAQVAASLLPIKHLHLVQAARLIALEPRPYRVVVEVALPRPWHSSSHRPAAKSRSPGAPHRGSHSDAGSPPARPCVPWR